MQAGFAQLNSALTEHVKSDDEAHLRLADLEKRLREMELEQARESTKLKLIMTAVGLGSSGAGALLAKFLA
jgi:hypothetical protein